MPYIPAQYRRRLDPLIDRLAEELRKIGEERNEDGRNPGVYAGLLNYAVSRLIGKFALLTFEYWTVALLTGVLDNIKHEFYRRVVDPFEDTQIKKSGDLPEYEELVQKIGEIK